jgi:arylsulfatase A-like enzyme
MCCTPHAVTGRSDKLCTAIATNENYVRELRRAYYAVISLTDAAFGRVLDKLESTGLDQNTIVTFIGGGYIQ